MVGSGVPARKSVLSLRACYCQFLETVQTSRYNDFTNNPIRSGGAVIPGEEGKAVKRGSRGILQMAALNQIAISEDELREFCRKHYIKKLALFGSVLKGELRPESDVDVLVEFQEGHVPGLIELAGMEAELSRYFGGRKVDLRTPNDLSRYFRDDVMKAAEVLYLEVQHMIDGAERNHGRG